MLLGNHRLAVFVVSSIGLLVALACSSPTGPGVGEIVITPTTLTLSPGENGQLSVLVFDTKGDALPNAAVSYASGNETIVTVSPTGRVTAVGPTGTTSVTATAKGVVRSVTVAVVPAASEIRLTLAEPTIDQLESAQIDAVVLDDNSDPLPGREIAFTNLTRDLVTVSSTGLVQSLGPHGTAQVRATSGSASALVELEILQVPVGIEVHPEALRLGSGITTELDVVVLDRIGVGISGSTIAFASDAEAVATVDASGNVTAVGPLGTAEILVEAGEFSQKVPVTVVDGRQVAGVVAGSVAVPGAFGVAFRRAGDAFVSTMESGIYRIDPVAITAEQISTVASGLDLLIHPDDQTRAYIAHTEQQVVTILDLVSGESVMRSEVLPGKVLTALLSPDGQTLWVGLSSGYAVLDAQTLELLQHRSQPAVTHLTLHPTEPLLYLSMPGRVREIDMETRTTVRDFDLMVGFVQAAVVQHDGSEIYIADERGGIWVLDLDSGAMAEAESIFLPRGPYALALNADGSRLYASVPSEPMIVIVSPADRSVLSVIPVAARPRRIAVSPLDGSLLVAHESGVVTVVH